MFGRVDPMRQPTAEHSHLAGAFLALGDDPQPAPPQRSALRALLAVSAAIVLAMAAPLAWASPAPRDQPAATASGKAAGVEVDDDVEGPWPHA